jgi:hypothetical protein
MIDVINIDEVDYNSYHNQEKKYATWIKTGDTYTPIVDSEIQNKLEPGLYQVQNDRGGQLICKKQNLDNDTLICFEDSIFNDVNAEIGKFWNLKDKYKDNHLIHKRGILLEGPAGNGKSSLITLTIENLIKNSGIAFVIKNVESFYRTIEFQKNILRKIEPETPIITIIEDIDVFPDYALSDLLDYLDGKGSIDHSICLMTTNDSSELSPALLRPSRIDKRYIIDYPNESLRKKYFIFKNIPEDLLDKYVESTKGFSFAKLKELYVSTIILGNDFNETVTILEEEIEGKNYLEKDKLQIEL